MNLVPISFKTIRRNVDFIANKVFVTLLCAFCVRRCSLCFHSFSFCDQFTALSHEFVENKQLDHESTIKFPLYDKQFSWLLHKSNRPFILWVYPRKMGCYIVGCLASDLIQTLFTCPPNIPREFIAPINPYQLSIMAITLGGYRAGINPYALV